MTDLVYLASMGFAIGTIVVLWWVNHRLHRQLNADPALLIHRSMAGEWTITARDPLTDEQGQHLVQLLEYLNRNLGGLP